ncbi:MAG: BlaI/MecI/CopY family transcriptional regulator [Lachnospiraceae bacterium]|nr:BlaI/MecI/CopY family transcriptional regulator [Lachnospiraceae bacterium]
MEYKIAEGENKLAELVWEHEPMTSMELVRLCEQKLEWKKSTTFTVLKKLCNKGILQNKNSLVTSLVPREEFVREKSRRFVEDTFGGSLPGFIAAFMGKEKLSNEEIEELRRMIDNYKE